MRKPSRRTTLALGGAFGLAPSLAWAGYMPQDGRLLDVRDTRLWVEDYGPRHGPALLYVHGGPGLGVFEFSHYMRAPLRNDFRLILVDQRGVLRSEPWSGPRVSYDLLTEDFEALRLQLGIDRWTVLAHSWGGPIAMHYALKHASVEALIFENAVLDPHATGRNMLNHAADALTATGREDDARTVRRLAREADTMRMWAGMDEALNLLPSRQSLYVYDPAFLGFYSRITADSAIPDARWAQGTAMASDMVSNPQLLAPAWNKMSAVSVPTLVVRGEADPATSPEELALMRSKSNVEVVEVPKSGHFVHVERPQVFAMLIADWHRRTVRDEHRG